MSPVEDKEENLLFTAMPSLYAFSVKMSEGLQLEAENVHFGGRICKHCHVQFHSTIALVFFEKERLESNNISI
jgi:hypothetical protein